MLSLCLLADALAAARLAAAGRPARGPDAVPMPAERLAADGRLGRGLDASPITSEADDDLRNDG